MMQIKFEPRDIWIGLYWTPTGEHRTTPPPDFIVKYEHKFYLCIIPCFPIIWSWWL